ncbi:MAG: 60S ribosomal protein L20 [Watsoniomyces obsoletus]|nr:MAG: 60S ribosomal protein L20 [Watsoniomyces obsoletus]
MPPLESFPKSHVVTYLYYVGLIHFLEEDYIKAEEYLTQAWTMCHRDAKKNLELILTYLIPCHLINTHTLPSSDLLAPHPQLQALFGPICSCIKKGDLAGFDAALVAGEDAFVRQRIYLTLERGRDVALRNLFRRVFVATAFEDPTESEEGNAKGEVERVRGEKRTRILVAEFAAAVRLGSADAAGRHIEDDEVECLIANLIYKVGHLSSALFVSLSAMKRPSHCVTVAFYQRLTYLQNLIKGYISREHRMVVLHKGGAAFPGTGI